MAKEIKWQIPFESLNGTKYRLDIYAEDDGTWDTENPIQLMPGATPFVTDEDGNEDFFTPVRGWTGTIEVCTLLSDGTQLDIRDMMPHDNLSHPVRLIRIRTDLTPAVELIEWQGFMSSEAYSQAYTAIPDIFSFPVISVLEAMDSVEVEIDEDMTFKTVIGHVCYAMRAIQNKCGITLFNQMYLSTYCREAICSTYFYNNVYFETEEQISGDNITVEVHSISCKAILEQVAKFFGCCWREVGQNIWFEAVGKDHNFSFHSFTAISAHYIDGEAAVYWLSQSVSPIDLSSFNWMGTDHKRDIRQGAKRVKVAAKLKDFDCAMSLQECPVNSLVENPTARQSNWGEAHLNTNETFYSLAEHKHHLALAVFPTDLSGAHLDYQYPLSGINYNKTAFWETSVFREHYRQFVNEQSQGINDGTPCYLTSFMMYLRDTEDNELKSCLAICGVPKRLIWSGGYNPQGRVWRKFTLTDSNYVFKQTTPLIFSASSGYLNIDIETLAWSGVGMLNPDCPVNNKDLNEPGPSITIAVRLGSKWLYQDGDTYTWDDEFHTINYAFNRGNNTKFGKFKPVGNWSSDMPIDEKDGLLVEISEPMTGMLSVYVYHEVNAYTDQPYVSGMFDVMISKMDVSYIPLPEELRTDRSENVYATETGQAFRDDVSTNLDIASDANNTKLATMLWSDGTTPIKLLTLGGSSIRPEVALLNRMAEYYSSARQTLSVISKHLSYNLQAIKLNGINDGKVYLPLSESRDWKTDVCTIKCFESPEEPETPSES